MIDSAPDLLASLREQLAGWFRRVIGLLNHHVVELVDRDYVLGCIMMTETGGVQAAVFKKMIGAPPPP